MHREFAVPSRRLGGARGQGNLRGRGNIEEEWRKVGRGALGCSVLICYCVEPKILRHCFDQDVQLCLDGERDRGMASVGLGVYFLD